MLTTQKCESITLFKYQNTGIDEGIFGKLTS
jgi:hypothetical protein